jgi:tetratricopeptide (TPR) repeat protein
MKKILITAAFVLACMVSGNAQVVTPQASPKAVIEQKVGLTDVKIEYSRPSARGRSVYGELVPFGRMWRTGANANTTISFSNDVVIAGKTLKAGQYALFTQPKADSWDVVFYNDTTNWGLPEKYDDSKEVLRASVKPEFLSRPVETLTIAVNGLDNDFAFLEISWEKTLVALKFEVPTKQMAMKSIEATLNGPSANDLFSAAQYYYQSNGDQNKALAWMNQAIAKFPTANDVPFYFLRQKSLIQAKLGDKKGAIETAKLSLAASEKAGNNDYVKMNKDSINEWSKK